MKFPLLTAALMLLAPMSALAAAPAPSPVGTWEVNLAGADQGIAYVTFEEDQDFTAYGVSAKSFGVFSISGTWEMDEKGRLSAVYEEWINGEDVTGTISGKVTAKAISGKISASNGNFSFKGMREKVTQDLSGVWNGTVAVGKKTRLAEVYQISGSELPHIYEVTGVGVSPTGGEFQIAGVAIAGSKGKVRIFVQSEYPWTETPGLAHLFGTVNVAKKKGALKGFESGQVVKVGLKRQSAE
ncbi:hypothetical protein [Luteolibacter sp. Populi]|uniref:hypothetical protein n=1 Tax=Luteolibacter sp. Populi TaxID=3230487 RepID=UPI0034675A7F